MKKTLFLLLFSMLISNLAFSTDGGGGSDTCVKGGPGEPSCTHTVTVGIITTTYSVTCNAGYYACCTDSGASCKKNNSQE